MDNSIRNKRKTKVRVACAVMGAMSILVLALYGCQPAQTSGTASKSDEAATGKHHADRLVAEHRLCDVPFQRGLV